MAIWRRVTLLAAMTAGGLVSSPAPTEAFQQATTPMSGGQQRSNHRSLIETREGRCAGAPRWADGRSSSSVRRGRAARGSVVTSMVKLRRATVDDVPGIVALAGTRSFVPPSFVVLSSCHAHAIAAIVVVVSCVLHQPPRPRRHHLHTHTRALALAHAAFTASTFGAADPENIEDRLFR